MSNQNNSINMSMHDVVWNPVVINKNENSLVKIQRKNKCPHVPPNHREVIQNVYFLILAFLFLTIIYEIRKFNDKHMKQASLSLINPKSPHSYRHTQGPVKSVQKQNIQCFFFSVIQLNSISEVIKTWLKCLLKDKGDQINHMLQKKILNSQKTHCLLGRMMY